MQLIHDLHQHLLQRSQQQLPYCLHHHLSHSSPHHLKAAKAMAKSNHSTRPQVVVNCFPEDQDVFNGSKLLPGEFYYASAVKSTRLNSGKQNCMIIFGDSIFCGIHFCEFNNEIKNGYEKFKTFPSAYSRKNLTLCQPKPRIM